MGNLVENYNVVNAYVDTSYIRRNDGVVMVSSFSSDDGNIQELPLKNILRVTAKDGFKFDLDNLDNYYFDVQFQTFSGKKGKKGRKGNYDSSLPFTRVRLSEFISVTDISNYDWIKKLVDYQLYKNVNSDGSMYYTYTIGNTKHLILLYGGLREKDLLFFTFTNTAYSEDFTMNGDSWGLTEVFSLEGYDPVLDENISVSFLNNLNFVAIPSTTDPIEDTSKYLFNTYYIDNSDLSRLRGNSGLTSEVIINTYSYPINFSEEDLIDVDFSVANITQNIPAKRFLKNNTEIEIFKFTVPDVPNVVDIRIRIPFNNDVTLQYEDVKGKTITGRFVYEVLTNTTTLFINDGVSDIYKNMVGIGVAVPYNPSGQYRGGSDPTTRLTVDTPKMFIKGVGKTVKGNYIRGFIGKVLKDMLSSEREKLNTLLENGVYFND